MGNEPKADLDLLFATLFAGGGNWRPFSSNSPAAWGVVYSDGVKLGKNSGNFQVSHPSKGKYIINFTGADLIGSNLGDIPVNVSLYGAASGSISYTGAAGNFTVYTFDAAGAATDRGFSFVVYNP